MGRVSAAVVMLTSVVMHSLPVSAFQTTFLPSAATCGPNRGGRCGIGAMQQRCGLRSGSRGMRAAMSSPGIPPQEQQGPTFFAALWYIHTHKDTHTHTHTHTHTDTVASPCCVNLNSYFDNLYLTTALYVCPVVWGFQGHSHQGIALGIYAGHA
jgi:hypothetical protein